MQIHQLNLSHDERQDRLLLKVSTQGTEEFRFWLTRRLTLRLMPALQDCVSRMEANQPGVMAADTDSKQLLTQLRRDAVLQQTDFATPYTPLPRSFPLGDAPMLVTEIQLQLQQAGLQMVLEDKHEDQAQTHSCQLQLPASLVHGLIHLLLQVSGQAQWQSLPHSPVAASGLPEAPASGYRH